MRAMAWVIDDPLPSTATGWVLDPGTNGGLIGALRRGPQPWEICGHQAGREANLGQ